jgi:uncharacterized cofD-like protein
VIGAGPAVAALGGGHGLAATLRAARRYASAVTAVVSVADDGGSSGRLREAFGILPPGDLRKCLVALGGGDGTMWADTLEYRFTAGELEGHALGNLLLAGLAAVTGSWQVALEEVGRLVRAEGRILPATCVPVVLKATAEGTEVHGQEAVARTARIDTVAIVPPDTPAPPEAVAAVREADQVILGPGSLYTSVLAVAAVPDLLRALADTRATRVYVCNLRPQVSETAGYAARDHLAALTAHGVTVDCVVCDPATMDVGGLDVPSVQAPLARSDGLGHDPGKLAAVLAGLVG